MMPNKSVPLDANTGGNSGNSTSRSGLVRKAREPYRATRLWVEAVAVFRRGVPLGKHRRQWRTYENCFVASEAITWYQLQLQRTFCDFTGSKQREKLQGITRQQTLHLLQKLYKSRIFTPVNGSSNSSLFNTGSIGFVNENDFKDNGQLYRLILASDAESPGQSGNNTETLLKVSKASTPEQDGKVSQNNGCGNYSVIIRPLSLGQVNSFWEQHFIQKFTSLVGLDVVRTLYSHPNLIPGHWIAHNLTQIGKYGIVIITKKNDDLPRWLIHAMKCLANWPNHHTNDQPNYPGFENDVFKLIVDYFNKTCFNGKGPLLTFGLYDAFITSFIHAELFDFNTRLYTAKPTASATVHTPALTNCPKNFNINSKQFQRWNTFCSPANMFPEAQYPFNASESIENLLLDILTPQTREIQQRRRGLLTSKRVLLNSLNNDLDDSVGQEKIDEPKAMPEKSYDLSRYSSAGNKVSGNSSCYYYETAFTNDSSPLTRVISKTELQSSFGSTLPLNLNSMNQSMVGGNSGASDKVEQTFAYENPTLDLSGSELIHHPKYSKLIGGSTGFLLTNTSEHSSTSASTTYSFCEYSNSVENNPASLTSGGLNKTDALRKFTSATKNVHEAIDTMMNSLGNSRRLYGKSRSYSAVDLSDSYRDRSPYVFDREGLHTRGGIIMHEIENSCNKSLRVEPPPDGPRRNLDFYYGADACIPGLMTTEGKNLAIRSFRMLTLLLPPTNRRHLQLLLRCMAKMARNEKLMLDVAVTTRAMVVNTFFKNILYSFDDNQFDELLALRIVTFMMDNDSEIFCVQDETAMVDSVKQMITEEQIVKVPNEKTPVPSATVSKEVSVVQTQTIPVKAKEKSTPKMSSSKRTPAKAVPKTLASDDDIEFSDKENRVQYCVPITLAEYEDQKLLGGGGTAPSLRILLDTILEDRKLNKKQKKERLYQFIGEYPHVFVEKFGDSRPEDILNSYTDDSTDNSSPASGKSSEKMKQSKKLNPFNRLFKNLRF